MTQNTLYARGPVDERNAPLSFAELSDEEYNSIVAEVVKKFAQTVDEHAAVSGRLDISSLQVEHVYDAGAMRDQILLTLTAGVA